jgi:hypothetical protein
MVQIYNVFLKIQKKSENILNGIFKPKFGLSKMQATW